MKLPSKFQMRHVDHKGFTNTAEVVDGKVKVKWARGYAENLKLIPNSVFHIEEAEFYVENGNWIIVDQPEAKQGDALPDVIHFENPCGEKFTLTKHESIWKCWHRGEIGKEGHGAAYDDNQIEVLFASGYWIRTEAKHLTAEQLRANAEAREQISSLQHNIKLRKQDVEHAQILIANYESGVKELESKILEEI